MRLVTTGGSEPDERLVTCGRPTPRGGEAPCWEAATGEGRIELANVDDAAARLLLRAQSVGVGGVQSVRGVERYR